MVSAMDDPLIVRGNTAIPLDEIELRASRSSGPGGQHANKTSSRIEASFDVSASQALSDAQKRRIVSRLGPRVVAVAQDARSQRRNRELALERLAGRLSDALEVQRPRRATRPSGAAVQRRLTDKRRQADRKAQRRPPKEDQ
jgi:ribosome-associated protein